MPMDSFCMHFWNQPQQLISLRNKPSKQAETVSKGNNQVWSNNGLFQALEENLKQMVDQFQALEIFLENH